MIVVQKGLPSVFKQSSGLVQYRAEEDRQKWILTLDHNFRNVEQVILRNNCFEWNFHYSKIHQGY